MSAELTISLDYSNFKRFRTLLQANKKIAAQSLTFSSEKARDAWRLANHSAFHMRRDWLDKGVRIKAAKPNDLHATVGSIDKFMGRFVKGVNEEKRSAGSGIFIPKYDGIDEVGTHTQIRRKLAAMAQTKSKPFWQHGMLLRRMGKGHDAPLTVVGFVRDRVKIEPRLDAVEIVDAAVNAAFPTVYSRLLRKWSEGDG